MSPMTSKQRQALRALAHHLRPVVQIGHDGLSDSVTAQVEAALAAHELIKVKIDPDAPVERDEAGGLLGERTRSELVQAIGHVVVLYRRRPKKPKVKVPNRKGREPKDRPKGSKGRRPRRRTHGRKAAAKPRVRST